MYDRTGTMINLLSNAEWFSKVANAVNGNVLAVGDWEHAIAHLTNGYWEDLHYYSANQLFEAGRVVNAHKGNSSRNWNLIATEIRSIVIPLVEDKTVSISKAQNLPKVFMDQVLWDMLHIAMATDFSDVFIPDFYASLAYWYLEGHFPCGWEGEYPKGRLIIY
jgi:hypothetical protein